MKRLILFLIIILLVTSCGGVEQTIEEEPTMPDNFIYLGKTTTRDYVYRINDGDVICYLVSGYDAVDIECLP